MKQYKIIVIGDTNTGKSTLISQYRTGDYNFVPHVLDTVKTKFILEKQNITLEIVDTDCDYDKYQERKASYCGVDIILLCFDTSCPIYENLSRIWIPEIKANAPNIPILLIGTKSDKSIVKPYNVKQKVKELDVVKYIECSAVNNKNIHNIFETAVNILETKNRKRWCILL